jgi:hypothetical protein
MREVDRRSKYNRRVFLQGAATAVPTVAIATSAGLGINDAWADDATTLTPATLKTLVKVARDIYPHDFLGDSYYITAIKPWDGKAAKDPGVKSLINDGVARLDQEANDRHKVPYAQVQWEVDRVALLQRIEQSAFFRLSLQPEGAMAQVRLRGLLRRIWRLHQPRLRRYRLAPEGLGPGNKRSRGDPNGKIRSE